MAGSMGSMYIGVSGLQSSQNALNTTAHNLTNLKTIGYSRQQVIMNDLSYAKISQTGAVTNTIGTGTKVEATKQVRDNFLDASYRNENGRKNYYLSQYETLSEVETYFGELESNTFSSNLKDLWSTIEEMNNESNSGVTRSAFVETANTFVERANQIYDQLVTYQTNLNDKIIDQVDRINEIATKIYDCNKEIIEAEASGVEEANDYRDARNALIDELSGLININVSENIDGSVDVYAEGRTLVSQGRTFKIETQLVSGDSNFLKPVWEGDSDNVFNLDKKPNTEANTDVGSLKGLIMSRGEDIPNYTDIPEMPVATDYATTALYDAAMTQYNSDVETYNNKLEPCGVSNIIATFDKLINGITTTVNDILSPNKKIQLLDGSYINVLDEAKAGIGMGDGNDIQGTELFTRNSVKRYQDPTTVTLADGTTATVRIYNEESATNEYSLYNLGNIQVNGDLLKDPSLLPINSLDGGEYQEITEALLKAWKDDFSTLNPNTLINNNFNDFYGALIEDFSNKAYTFDSLAQSQGLTVGEIDAQRQQVVGVSSDEELSNLIKFQHAYNASSRYINVVAEMMDHIINKLG